MICPYVYKLTHRITGHFYFGYRSKNKVPSQLDLGIKYFTSGKITKKNFHEYDYEILAEFFDPESAYNYEQSLIFENKNDPLILNKQFRFAGGKQWICKAYDPTSRKKMSLSAIQHRKTLTAEQKKEIYSKVSAAISGCKNPRALYWLIEYADGRESEKVKSLTTWCANNRFKYATLYNRAKREDKSFWHGVRISCI